MSFHAATASPLTAPCAAATRWGWYLYSLSALIQRTSVVYETHFVGNLNAPRTAEVCASRATTHNICSNLPVMGQALGTVLSFCTPPRQGPGRERGTDNVEFESDDGTAVSGRTTTTTAAAAALLVPHQEQPRMVMDFEQDTCYACDIRFDVLVRRHHCRRCRNIYW